MKTFKTTLTIPEKDLVKNIAAMMEDSSLTGVMNIGWNRTDRQHEALAKSISTSRGMNTENFWKHREDVNRMFFFLDRDAEKKVSDFRESFPLKNEFKHDVGVIAFSRNKPREHFAGWVFTPGSHCFTPISSIKIVGKGIHRVYGMGDRNGGSRQQINKKLVPPDIQAENILRYSRTDGALGEKNRERLVGLNFAIIGAGRLGSLVLNSLVRMGSTNISIIDPDRVEFHNIDTGDCLTLEDVGEFKVTAQVHNLRKNLFPNNPPGGIKPIPYLLNSYRALEACREADIIICCVDQDFPRFAAGYLGSIYLKPVLDMGTGVFYSDDNQREMGADIRLFVPGDACIQCMGGTAGRIDNSRIFIQREQEESFMMNRNWRNERAGSLRSLNQIAAHIGIRMLEDFVSERISSSRWVRVNFDSQGIISAQTFEDSEERWSCLCHKKGLGDLALSGLSKKEWEKMIQWGDF